MLFYLIKVCLEPWLGWIHLSLGLQDQLFILRGRPYFLTWWAKEHHAHFNQLKDKCLLCYIDRRNMLIVTAFYRLLNHHIEFLFEKRKSGWTMYIFQLLFFIKFFHYFDTLNKSHSNFTLKVWYNIIYIFYM